MTTINTATVRAQLLEILGTKGGTQINPNVVMDAATYLELAGESIRSRICTFNGVNGEEMCLRPDLTIPLARMVANGEIEPGRYFYSGRVFRLPEADSTDALEFSHTGFEVFGDESSPQADADGVSIAFEGLKKAGVSNVTLRLGASNIFRAFITALDLPEPWSRRLLKAYSRQQGPLTLLEASKTGAQDSSLASALAALTPSDAAKAVEEMLEISGVSVVGGRTPPEIAERLISRAKENRAGPVPPGAAKAITAFMEVAGDASTTTAAFEAVAKDTGVDISSALDLFSSQVDAITASLGEQDVEVIFSSTFGRRFEYYDGLVFEFCEPDSDKALATGGRYDGLVKQLSNESVDVSAFGVAMRPDRIAGAALKELAR